MADETTDTAPEAKPTTPPETPPATPPDAPPAPERPAWLPEKFKTPEDLAKSYKALEAKLGARSAAPAIPDPPAAPKFGDEDTVPTILAKIGLDQAQALADFRANGALSDDYYAKLSEAGLPRGLVDPFLKNEVAALDALTTTCHTLAGGEQQFENLMAWASTSLSAAERAKMNTLLASPATAEDAVRSLLSRHAEAVKADKAKPLLDGEMAPAETAGFASGAEVRAAMRDPRWGRDSAYTETVKARLAQTPQATVNSIL